MQKLFFAAVENKSLDARSLTPLLGALSSPSLLRPPTVPALPAPEPTPDAFEPERQAMLAQLRQLETEKVERLRQDEAKAAQEAREADMAKERAKMEAEMRQRYEAEFAQRLADDASRKARARASRRSGRKSGRSLDDTGSSGTNEESLSTPPTKKR